jgi:putative endonuclease
MTLRSSLSNRLGSWLRNLFRIAPLGRRGERQAAKFLQQRGYRILERNREVGDDEADLIALDPDGRTVVIVEVKTRARDATAPEMAVNRTKQFRMSRLASNLSKTTAYRDRPFRFDALAIVWPEGGQPVIRHHIGAFQSPW